jgi:hypothetical protein
VDRSKLYIATKVNPSTVGAEHPTRSGAHGYDEEIVLWSCQKSIERLKCVLSHTGPHTTALAW